MNVINKLKLNFLYPELKNLNIDDEILEPIISSKNFKTQYKANIKPFIKYLRDYKAKLNNASLRDILRYVYIKYPDFTKKSLIRDDILGDNNS